MSPKAQHTPLDWCRVTTRDWAGVETFKHALIGHVDSDAPIATCVSEEEAPELVRRWNAHEELVEELKRLATRGGGCASCDVVSAEGHEPGCTLAAALAKAMKP